MKDSSLSLPLKLAVVSLLCLAGGIIHISSSPTLVAHQLGSKLVQNSLSTSDARLTCDHNGFILENVPSNCIDYYWYDELRYRVVRDERIRIYSMAQPKYPHLIGAVSGEGVGEVTKGGARPTFEFMFEILLGVVATKEPTGL